MADLPATCRVLTSEAPPFAIKNASPSWFSLWQLSPAAIGQPISAMLKSADADASSKLMTSFRREGHAKVRLTNARPDGLVIGHDLELIKTAEGLLATSTAIAPAVSLKERLRQLVPVQANAIKALRKEHGSKVRHAKDTRPRLASSSRH